jgi:hypothetical protein
MVLFRRPKSRNLSLGFIMEKKFLSTGDTDSMNLCLQCVCLQIFNFEIKVLLKIPGFFEF